MALTRYSEIPEEDFLTDLLPPRRSERVSGRLGLFVVVVLSLALSVAYFHGAWRSPHSWSGILGDPEQMMWFLAWVPHALLQGHNPLVSSEVLVPQRVNLMWNTSILLPALLMSPVTLLAGPMTSYNVLVVLAPVCAAGTGYLLARRYVRSSAAAIAGGLSFGFCPFLLIQSTSHPQLYLLALVPLIVLVLDELVVRQQWRSPVIGIALGALGAAQLLTGEEMFAITALACACALLALAVLHPTRIPAKLPYLLRGGVVAVATFAVLAGAPLLVQYRGPQRAPLAHGSAGIGIYVTDLWNFIQPAGQRFAVNVVHQPLSFSGGPYEWMGYLGVPLILLVGWVALREIRRPVVPVTLFVMVVFALFSLGPQLHIDGRASVTLPWRFFAHLFSSLENILPARFSVVVDLGAAILIAVFVDRLVGLVRPVSPVPVIGVHSPRPAPVPERGLPQRVAAFLAGLALLALVWASWVPVPAPVTSSAVPSFFTSAQRLVLPAGSVALVAPYVDGPNQESAMEWQAASRFRFRMVDGWMIVPGRHQGPGTVAATTSVTLQQKMVVLTPHLRAELSAYLRRSRVHEVIVGPGPGRTRAVTFFRTYFQRGPSLRAGGVTLWWVKDR